MEEALRKSVTGEKGRYIITIPPRHGKTQMSAIYFPSWALGKYPELQFILSTYGAELSEKSGMKTRDVIASEGYQALFPGIELRPDQKAKAKWQTNKGGAYTAVGIGGAVTGMGANIILIDDPHKDRAEAESALMRENVWEYYKDTLYSRLEGSGVIILIMQRWHTDDLVGRVLEFSKMQKEAGEHYDEWEVINFPAIANEDEPYRKKGQPLWPSKFGLDVLANIKSQGLYKWASQYQQDPIMAENQEFKESMFQYFTEADLVNKRFRYTTTVDPAGYEGNDPDENVVLTVAKEIDGDNWYVVEIDHGVFDPGKTIDAVFKHHDKYGSEVYVESVAYQKTLKWHIEERQKKEHNYFYIRELKSRSAKEERIRGLIPLFNRGVLHFRNIHKDLELQLLQFPRSKKDDQMDALAMQLDAVHTTIGSRAKQTRSSFKGYFGKKR